MATSVDIRTYVLMSGSHDAGVTLDLYSRSTAAPYMKYDIFLGKDMLYVLGLNEL